MRLLRNCIWAFVALVIFGVLFDTILYAKGTTTASLTILDTAMEFFKTLVSGMVGYLYAKKEDT